MIAGYPMESYLSEKAVRHCLAVFSGIIDI